MKRTHKRKIVCAAVKLGGIVLPCIRHWDVGCHVLADSVWGIDVQNLIRQGQEEQGFIDNEGQFLDRKQAAILYNSYSRKKVGKMLFSEDLY